MCNLYRIKSSRSEVATTFDAIDDPELPLLPEELYPKRQAFVIRDGGAPRLDVMNWGFPPPQPARAPVTNVRNFASPFWQPALARPDRRCLVPVSEFCEWEGEKGAKVKRWFAVADRPLFAFAGVWPPTEQGKAFAFLTCEPNPLVAPIHPKAMPVILHKEDHGRRLTEEGLSICDLAAPFPSQLMKIDA